MTAPARELAKYKLDSERVKQVRRDSGGTELAENHTFRYVNGKKKHEIVTPYLYVKESNQQLRGYSFLPIDCPI
jgi:hypothetical protein